MPTSLATPSAEELSDPTRLEPDQYSELSATRHLCAGVYLDRPFRELVIRKVHNDSRRRIAPSYGFDLVPVVRHAWHAWVLEVVLHTAVLAILTTGLVLHQALAVVIVLCATAMSLVLADAVRNLAEFVRLRALSEASRWSERSGSRLPLTEMQDLDTRKRRLKLSFAGFVVLGLVPAITARILGKSLHTAMPTAITLAAALMVSGVVVGILRQLRLNANQRAQSLRPATLSRREKVLDEQQSPRCVVYQRPTSKTNADPLDLLLKSEELPSPFVGSGKLVNRWLPPMTVQLLRPDPSNRLDLAQREHTKPPFQAHQLVDQLKTALTQLTTDRGNENLPGLQVRDRLYVAESDISKDRTLLNANDFFVKKIIDNPLTTAHHFLETCVPIAGGELVTTVLIRVSLKGRCLSLDVATCALTRTRQEFQVIDRHGEHGRGAVARAAFRDLVKLPGNVLRVWRSVEVPVVLVGAWWATKDRTHKPRRGVEVSPRVTIRDAVADDWNEAHLDKTTIYDHMKIIEQRIIKTAMDFLRDHDVDTSAFERQAMNIINSGVLNMGGTTIANNAVGASAKIMLSAAQNLQAVAQDTKEQSA